ncbi:hypothetical protein KI387_005294, partial [Taxus chinensis]
RMDLARQVFDKMPERNVVLWSAMISGYVQNRMPNEAWNLFDQMQLTEVKPNRVTVLSVLTACTGLAALQQGRRIHDYVIQNRMTSDVVVGTALVVMYCNCRSIEIAREVFDKLSKRDVVAWSAMIAGYLQNGHAEEALLLFHQMQMADLNPNQVTILSLLPLCANLAALRQ